MSQSESSDTQFFNSFSMVLGLLVAFAIVLFAVARTMGADSQGAEVLVDPLHLAEVQKNIAPFSQEAIAGKDNSALAALSAPAGAAPAASVPTTRRAGIQGSMFRVPRDGGQWSAEDRRSCGLGTAYRAGQRRPLQNCDLGQGQYAAQRRHELAGRDNPHDRGLHGVAQQIGRSRARSFTASATSTIRISGARLRSAQVRATLSTRW